MTKKIIDRLASTYLAEPFLISEAYLARLEPIVAGAV